MKRENQFRLSVEESLELQKDLVRAKTENRILRASFTRQAKLPSLVRQVNEITLGLPKESTEFIETKGDLNNPKLWQNLIKQLDEKEAELRTLKKNMVMN